MNKIILLVLVLILYTSASSFIKMLNGTIEGKVIDKYSEEPILFASVVLSKNGTVLTTAETDMEGNFLLSDIEEGNYTIEVNLLGYNNLIKENIEVKQNQVTKVSLKLESREMEMNELVTAEYKVPLIQIDHTTTGTKITSEKIEHLSPKSIHAIEATSKDMSKGDLSVSGYRSSETVYFIDGIRTSGSILKSEKKTSHLQNIVTAGEWNDLHNWEKWRQLLHDEEYRAINMNTGIYYDRRYAVFIKNKSNQPVHGIMVELIDKEAKVLWTAITDIDGRAELWFKENTNENPKNKLKLKIKTTNKYFTKEAIPDKDGENVITIDQECSNVKKLQICFLTDATGSMSDEIEYLKSDLHYLMDRVSREIPDMEIESSSVFYRDKNDEYITRIKDFDDSLSNIQDFISKQNAAGGGDFHEAVDQGLKEALKLSWDLDVQTSKIIFLILDAPPHKDSMSINTYKNAIIEAASKGIKIIPISASGIDRETEFLLKNTAMLTNSTYVFITDHSGVGNTHLTPVHNDFKVESLQDVMVRLILAYSKTECCSRISNPINLKINPNPASDEIKIEYGGIPKTINIYSSSGRLLWNEKGEFNEKKIKISNLTCGWYLAELVFDDNRITGRFLVVR